jgi:molybdate transport system substrate-binding protein
MKKKLGVLIFSLFLVFGIALFGCGSKANNASSAAPSGSPSASTETSPSPSASPSAAPAETVQLTVSAAASLTESLNEIKPLYEASHPGTKLAFNYGASGTLQKQIEQGAPADLFLSAGKKQMTELADKKLIDPASVKNLLLNDLVVIVPSSGGPSVATLEDLAKPEVKKLAVGTPESVPAGSYAKEALTYYKLWDSLQSKIVLTKDVKQVLNYVETGNTEAGFVYRSDALGSDKVKVVLTVDPKSHQTIEYPIGIIAETRHRKETEDLYKYLQTKEALDIFAKHGFKIPQ